MIPGRSPGEGRSIYGLFFLFMSVRSSLFLSFVSSDLSTLSFFT
ncbi:hypothetical protein LSS_02369 [Leptospira santarosai serovar Shermani str. LT 821]|uniref:Uncharacterized protein n=1 Tax=Leptospira santarosai serovar Shermani str. LT 821 TaxID=758847 RepID=K8YFP6_9LEPT|nr:hypothetical protein LSS_02369 [Leptospira santarosai serovar Shermani str. LT 821]